MWPLQLTYSPQLLAKYIQSQNINPTNKCFPIVGRINTITIYIYIFNFNIFPQCIYLYWIYSGNNYMLYLRVSLFCKTVFVTSGSQFSRGPICRGPKKFTQIYLPYLWHYATLIFIYWYWIYSANNWEIYVNYRVFVRPSAAGLQIVHFLECVSFF